MEVDLLVVPGCPHIEGAQALLRAALDDVGLGRTAIRVTVVETEHDAEIHHFPGSPTILLDGRDPFAEPHAQPAVACRVYPGGSGLPDLRDLRQALKRAAADEGLSP